MEITLGVVCLARQTFDYREAERKYGQIQQELKTLPGVRFTFVPELLFERDDALAAAGVLARENPDGLVCISGTFHLGSLVLELSRNLGKPILLWALEEPPYDGGKIRLNSLCGVNLDASNLYKGGVRNYHACFGDRIDRDWIDALKASTLLGKARIALAGSRAHTFYNMAFDELAAWSDLGTLIDIYPLQEIFRWPITEPQQEMLVQQLRGAFQVEDISEKQLQLTASLAARIDGFMTHHRIDALALRCWPEFAAEYGVAPCAAMSLLQGQGRVIACEGDVEGALSMLAHRALGMDTPYLADLSQVDFATDEALLWHCGAAPCSLWDGRSRITLDSYHAGGKGVTAGFVLRDGPVSIVRIDSAGSKRRLFTARGTALPMEKALQGTYARVRFDGGTVALMHRVIEHGIAHHVSVAYGDYSRPLQILARVNGWEIIA